MAPNSKRDDDGGPFGKWLTWGHGVVTIALCTLVWNMWHDARVEQENIAKERVALEARIVALEGQDKVAAVTAAAITAQLAAIDGRQSAILLALQNHMAQTAGNDRRGVNDRH